MPDSKKNKQHYPKIILLALILLLIGIGGTKLVNQVSQKEMINPNKAGDFQNTPSSTDSLQNIFDLTDEIVVAHYLRKNHQLPSYYLTKEKARALGWNPEKGNLCEKLPGRAIGGDPFGNRERLLPIRSGRKYFEADVNYNCGRRGTDRLIYSSDGLIFVTKDHYKTYKKL